MMPYGPHQERKRDIYKIISQCKVHSLYISLFLTLGTQPSFNVEPLLTSSLVVLGQCHDLPGKMNTKLYAINID